MKKKIEEYFSTGGILKVLDDGNKPYYTGVTAQYISKYVTGGSVSKTAETLLKMHSDGEIKALYCDDLKDVIFENINGTDHGNYQKRESLSLLVFKRFTYEFFIKKMNKLISQRGNYFKN